MCAEIAAHTLPSTRASLASPKAVQQFTIPPYNPIPSAKNNWEEKGSKEISHHQNKPAFFDNLVFVLFMDSHMNLS